MEMERKIGEIFEFEGKKLKVEISKKGANCIGCYFSSKIKECYEVSEGIKNCANKYRKDRQYVIFVEVKED